jgi:hypothetical protein
VAGTRGQKAAAVVGLIIVLGAAAWVLVPFSSGGHSCDAAALSWNDKVHIPAQAAVAAKPGDPYSFDYAHPATPAVVKDTRCTQPAQRRLWTSGVLAALAIIGAAVSWWLLSDSGRSGVSAATPATESVV